MMASEITTSMLENGDCPDMRKWRTSPIAWIPMPTRSSKRPRAVHEPFRNSRLPGTKRLAAR